jgi:beta-galactosidase
MKKIEFNQNWIFYNIQTGEEGSVSIPHDAMLFEPRKSTNPGRGNISWFAGGLYEYRKMFTITEQDKDKWVCFEFEGVYRNAEVFINGVKAAYRPNGYTNFYVEATDLLKYDALNEIKVIVHNEEQPNSRWYTGSGIYRPVYMYLADKKHITMNGIKIRTISIEPATIEVEVTATEAGTAKIEILDHQSEVIYTVETITNSENGDRILIPGAKLWSCDTPYLYVCRVTYGNDTIEEEFGIRSLQISKEKGLLINGNRVILRGACIHHDNGILGACCYPKAEERKIRILKENGYNSIRSAHNQCSKALLRACDRQGILVMDEYVDVWYIHKNKYDYVKYFADWWKQDLKDMVEKDYNHPSVILYSIGNEVAETAQKKGIELTREMTEYLHQLDSERSVTCGVNIFFNLLSSLGFGVYSDKKSEKELEKTKAVGSEFYNKLAGMLGNKVIKIGALLPGCDAKTREAFANMDIAGYNYGILRYKRDLKKYPHRLILGTETFCKDAAAFWDIAKDNPGIIGDFVWAGMDYLGEVGIGSWEYKEYAPDFQYGPGWISAGSGRIDLVGNPLAEAAYTKIAFEQSKDPFIAVVPLQHKGKHSPSAWKMSNARNSWSWDGCEGKMAEIEVYARGAYVELYKNDVLVGRKKIKKSCRVRYKTTYEPGKLTAVAYDSTGVELGRHELRTAGVETVISISPEELQAETGDIIYVPIRYTDRNGVIKPVIRGTIQVEVNNAKLIALGNACPYNKASYLGNTTDTYYGEAMAVILMEQEGSVEITANDGKQISKVNLVCNMRR